MDVPIWLWGGPTVEVPVTATVSKQEHHYLGKGLQPNHHTGNGVCRYAPNYGNGDPSHNKWDWGNIHLFLVGTGFPGTVPT